MGELEAQVGFKEKELKELKAQMDSQRQEYKAQIKQLKEELQMQKERVMKQQKSDAQAETYKKLATEASDMKTKIDALEKEREQLKRDIIKLEHELKT